MRKPLEIRAHHLLCIPRFYHGGYDRKFAENMKRICSSIRKNPHVKVKLIIGKQDALCKKCPHAYGNGCAQSKKISNWVVSQDKKVAGYLKLKPNTTHLAKDIFNLSMEKVNEKTIKSVCKGCIFLDNCIRVGINNSFRRDLNTK